MESWSFVFRAEAKVTSDRWPSALSPRGGKKDGSSLPTSKFSTVLEAPAFAFSIKRKKKKSKALRAHEMWKEGH